MMQILGQVIKSVWKTTITVCAIVGLAKVMVYIGMTDALAVALVSLLGPAYPLFAPLIGALGTFLPVLPLQLTFYLEIYNCRLQWT